jgi:hypothetical protein
VNVAVPSAGIFNEAGDTVTLNPGTVAEALNVFAEPETLWTRRVTFLTPASLPTAIDAWFSSDPEIAGSVSKGGLNTAPWLTM